MLLKFSFCLTKSWLRPHQLRLSHGMIPSHNDDARCVVRRTGLAPWCVHTPKTFHVGESIIWRRMKRMFCPAGRRLVRWATTFVHYLLHGGYTEPGPPASLHQPNAGKSLAAVHLSVSSRTHTPICRTPSRSYPTSCLDDTSALSSLDDLSRLLLSLYWIALSRAGPDILGPGGKL
jgi:hypothetical protein